MSQQNVYDFLESKYPHFVSFRYIADELRMNESTVRMNLQRLIDGGMVCKTNVRYKGKRKVVFRSIPLEETTLPVLTSLLHESINDDTE